MNMIPANRQNDFKIAIQNCNKSQGDVKYLDMDIVWDMETQFGFNTECTKIASGDVVRNNFFASIGMVLCKKSEATLLIIIGQKTNEFWTIGKTKNYWLKSIN